MSTDADSDSAPAEEGRDEEIRFAVVGGIARITIDRPTRRNAVTRANRDAMIALLDQCAERVDVRVVVLTGTGDAFCTGADLGAPIAQPFRPADAPDRIAGEVARGIRTNAQRLITSIMDCEKPIIAAVNGVAAGMGVHVALACDLIIAADDATFIEVFVRRGLVPDAGASYLLPRMIGPHKAKELFFLGDSVSADEAREIGLVNRVVPASGLEAAVAEWADRLAVGPTRSIAMCKALVNRSFDMDRDTAFAAEAMAQDLNMTTVDANEGVTSFVERRKPTYRGW